MSRQSRLSIGHVGFDANHSSMHCGAAGSTKQCENIETEMEMKKVAWFVDDYCKSTKKTDFKSTEPMR
jgi:hypothetical protein